jgi:hypothetical protein
MKKRERKRKMIDGGGGGGGGVVFYGDGGIKHFMLLQRWFSDFLFCRFFFCFFFSCRGVFNKISKTLFFLQLQNLVLRIWSLSGTIFKKQINTKLTKFNPIN